MFYFYLKSEMILWYVYGKFRKKKKKDPIKYDFYKSSNQKKKKEWKYLHVFFYYAMILIKILIFFKANTLGYFSISVCVYKLLTDVWVKERKRTGYFWKQETRQKYQMLIQFLFKSNPSFNNSENVIVP